MLTYEVAREMAERAAPAVRRAHLHAVHLGRCAGIPIEAYTEAIEDARVAAERDFGLVLRWIYDIPGESGLPAADATLAYALDHAPGRAGRLRPRRSGDRRAAAAVPAALRRGPGRRAALASRTRGRPPARRRSGTPYDCSAPSGSVTAPRRPQDPALLEHLAEAGIVLEVCPTSNIATRAVATLDEHPLAHVRRGRRRGHDQLRRPADVRHDPQRGVRRRGRPARPRRVRRRRPGAGGGRARPSPPTTCRPGSSARSTPTPRAARVRSSRADVRASWRHAARRGGWESDAAPSTSYVAGPEAIVTRQRPDVGEASGRVAVRIPTASSRGRT